MYLDSKDYQTVWRLAHNWVGLDPGPGIGLSARYYLRLPEADDED